MSPRFSPSNDFCFHAKKLRLFFGADNKANCRFNYAAFVSIVNENANRNFRWRFVAVTAVLRVSKQSNASVDVYADAQVTWNLLSDLCSAVLATACRKLHSNRAIQATRPERLVLDRRRWNQSLSDQLAVLHLLVCRRHRLSIPASFVHHQQWSAVALSQQLLRSMAQQFSHSRPLEPRVPVLKLGHLRAASLRLPLQWIIRILRP